MPVPLLASHHRAEAKYNVSTDFPSLGLHSAASSGNVGLVEYALSHGQPVNSVVDGLLPLHAACAGGNVHVVKLLIEYGADVNAPRLPKKSSSRDSSAPITGTTGSTPLHFAAANGNKDTIMLLLLRGAHADRPDKRGVTPEALARQNGWIECADLLREWILNKDKDLRERKEYVPEDREQGSHRHRLGSFGDPEGFSSHRRRLHVKQSIDTALNMLRSSSSNLTEAYHKGGRFTPTPPTSPNRPYGDYSQQQSKSKREHSTDSGTRRPSLPHIMQSDSQPRQRKVSSQSNITTNRSRSISSGGDDNENGHGKGGSARKLGSKVPILNLFRKVHGTENSEPISDAPSLSTSPPSMGMDPKAIMTSHHNSRGSSSGNLSNPKSHHNQHSSSSQFQESNSFIRSENHTVGENFGSPSRSPLPLAIDLHNALAQEQQRLHNRDRSRSNASSRYEHKADDAIASTSGSYHSPGSSPLTRLGFLRNEGHNRNRSGSGSSMGYEVTTPSRLGTSSAADDTTRPAVNGDASDNVSRSLPRSGILKPHNRSGSSGQGYMTPTALRTISRDVVNSHSPSPRPTPSGLSSKSSVGSLVRTDSQSRRKVSRRPESSGSTSGFKSGEPDDGHIREEEEEVDEEYGKLLSPTATPGLISGPSHLAPSSRTLLTPIIANDHAEGNIATEATKFPFSINGPPPVPIIGDDDIEDTLQTPLTSAPVSTKIIGVDNRQRGDSLSSNSTSESQSLSQTSSTDASFTAVRTPLMTADLIAQSDKKEDAAIVGAELVSGNVEGQDPQIAVIPPGSITEPSFLVKRSSPPPLPLQPQFSTDSRNESFSNQMSTSSTGMTSNTHGMGGRRTHTPFEIDIRSISTHAQAAALVEKARKEVIEFASLESDDTVSGDNGRTPLSARLAAYGESLALERKFRELEQGGGSAATTSLSAGGEQRNNSGTSPGFSPGMQHGRSGSSYAGSVYSVRSTRALRDASPRSVTDRARNRHNPKRPSTAEGLAPRDANYSLRSELSNQSQPESRSASALGHRSKERGFYQHNHHHSSQIYQPNVPTLAVSTSDGDNDDPRDPELTQRYVSRSRSPIPGYDSSKKDLTIGRMTSLQGLNVYDDGYGSDLYRVSTAPSPVKLSPAQAQGRSAKKLSKMGISVADQAGRNIPPPPVSHSGKRFGGFKSVLQSLKGKT